MRCAHNQRTRLSLFGGIAVLLGLVGLASAEYAVDWYTIDGGGAQSSAGGDFTLSGTIGQPDANAAVMTGGNYTLTGGFWVVPECSSHPASFDGDCDVDGDDFLIFLACVSGPAVAYDVAPLPAGCALTPGHTGFLPADFDQDRDIDQVDFAVFQRCWSGTDVPADPGCVD